MKLQPISAGSIIAIAVLILAIVFFVLGRLDAVTAGGFAALAIARLT